MNIRLSIILFLLGLSLGYYINDLGIKTGNIVFTNLKSNENETTTSDVFLIGERKFLRREKDILCEDIPLYDKHGNVILGVLKKIKNERKERGLRKDRGGERGQSVNGELLSDSG